MRRFLLGLACAVSLLPVPSLAQDETPSLLSGGASSPTFLGTTGLLLAPTAYTVGDRGIAAHAYFSPNFNSYGVTIGPMPRLEVGASLIDLDDSFASGDSQVIINAKYRLLEESQFVPGLAFGFTDLFDELDVDTSWYLAASKDLSKTLPLGGLNWRFHLGYGGGIYDDELFYGVEFRLSSPADVLPVSHPSFNVLAEVVGGDVNVGVRGRMKGFAATVSLFDFDDLGGGISYTTGLRLR